MAFLSVKDLAPTGRCNRTIVYRNSTGAVPISPGEGMRYLANIFSPSWKVAFSFIKKSLALI